MISVCLCPKHLTRREASARLDIPAIELMGVWLSTLPPTKRGKQPYRVCMFTDIPKIIFVRREDAITFRLKFGL